MHAKKILLPVQPSGKYNLNRDFVKTGLKYNSFRTAYPKQNMITVTSCPVSQING